MSEVSICGTCGRCLIEVREYIKESKEKNKNEIDNLEFMINTIKKNINIQNAVNKYKLNICCATTLMERIDMTPLVYGSYPIEPF